MNEVIENLKKISTTIFPKRTNMNTSIAQSINNTSLNNVGTFPKEPYMRPVAPQQVNKPITHSSHVNPYDKVTQSPIKRKKSVMKPFLDVFHWFTIGVFRRRENAFEQLIREISQAETSRLSKLREAAAIQAEIKKYEEHRDELIRTFEALIDSNKTMKKTEERLMSMMQDQQ